MSRPRLLDLFCGAGGAAVGYHRAGFDVVGVDHKPQPHFPYEFVQYDALQFLHVLISKFGSSYRLSDFDAIHASPPCQGYSRMRRLPWLKDKVYPMLLEPTLELLALSGLPWVVENVMDAPVPDPAILCGWSMGLPIYRHRKFGSSHLIMTPEHKKHQHKIASGSRNINGRRTASGGVFGVLPAGTTKGIERSFGTVVIVPDPCGNTAGSAAPHVKVAMGIDWMTRAELTQAIPPAFTEWIGNQLIKAVREPA